LIFYAFCFNINYPSEHKSILIACQTSNGVYVFYVVKKNRTTHKKFIYCLKLNMIRGQMPPLLWLLWLCQKPRHHPLRPTKWLKTTLRKGLLTYGRSRLRPYGTKGADPNATVLRSASTPPKVATGNSHCELLGEACNNGVLASYACLGLMTSTLGSSTVISCSFL